ncbi:hypothetical protein BDA96_02G255500 [Sorghum bicolor]|uniref:Uncharacterized protein n=1 Tax=Sorghum bicolor TaxID=4558 RepID=A0A921RR11_SORBI|nr:hypothetical protein BDA96_02G255500 [Sorghum bicolor]
MHGRARGTDRSIDQVMEGIESSSSSRAAVVIQSKGCRKELTGGVRVGLINSIGGIHGKARHFLASSSTFR